MAENQIEQLRERNYRSCIECSRRKVRCDRQTPCNNCVRNESQCIFPRFRKRPVKRQRSLPRSNDVTVQTDSQRRSSPADVSRESNTAITPSSSGHGRRSSERSNVSAVGFYDQPTDHRQEPTWLVRQQNKSRYISNSFWASMTREVRFLHCLTPLTI